MQQLHIATLWGHVEAVQTLLELGANPKAANRLTGATPLHMTVQSRKTTHDVKEQIVELLIAKGADTTVADHYGKLPLDYCLLAGDVPAGHRLLASLQPAEPDLFIAIQEADLNKVKEVIANAAASNDNDKSAVTDLVNLTHRGETPLLRAVTAMTLLEVAEEHVPSDLEELHTLQDIVELLLENGAKVNPVVEMDEAAAAAAALDSDESSSTPQVPPLQILLETIVTILKQPTKYNDVVPQPLVDVAKALQKAGSKSDDGTASSSSCLTVDQRSQFLHNAARRGHLRVLQFLLEELQWNVNDTNRQGMTALQFGARSGKLKVVQYLLQQFPDTIDVTHADDRGQTALQAAQINGQTEIVELLQQAVEQKAMAESS